MKFKIIVLITLVFGIVFGQKITDTTNVASETNDRFEQSLNAVKSDVRKLNKTVSALDSLLQTNQSLTNEKIHQLEKSITDQTINFDDKIKSIHSTIEQIKGELSSSITRMENNVNSNVSNSNSQFKELKNTINSLAASLVTTANSILVMKRQYSFKEAFLKARLELGKNQEFEWKGRLYSTNYPDEKNTPPIILKIEKLNKNLDRKVKELDKAIIKANSQITTLDDLIKKESLRSKDQYQS